jgi:hypothetical protein
MTAASALKLSLLHHGIVCLLTMYFIGRFVNFDFVLNNTNTTGEHFARGMMDQYLGLSHPALFVDPIHG